MESSFGTEIVNRGQVMNSDCTNTEIVILSKYQIAGY